MSNRFTEKAEKALNRSVTVAEELGHTYIGSEHILLALAEDELSCSSYILKKYGVEYKTLKNAICEYSGTGIRSTLSVRDMTPRTRQILETSYDNAQKYGGAVIGTDHILLSLLSEKDCVALRLMKNAGIDTLAIKQEVLTLLKTKEKQKEKEKTDTGTPNLRQYGKNLTEMAREDKFDPVVGRDRETERLIRILSRKNKNNPCLIGEAGVGKTAIVEGLAKRIVDGNVPEHLKNKSIISVDLTSMVAGAKYRGDFEERIKSIVNEVITNKNIILFIDEIHTIVGAGSAEGAIDAANILKPGLSRGDIQIIGATTIYEYHKYIEKDSALERRFQPIKVEEPNVDETVKMLRGIKERYEAHHNVYIDDGALDECVKLSIKYITDRFLPDKAIDLLDEACAFATAKNSQKALDSVFNTKQLKERKELAVRDGDFNLAIKIKELEDIYKNEYKTDECTAFDTTEVKPTVTRESVKSIISEIYGVPCELVKSSNDYDRMIERLNEEIFGQKYAVLSLISAIKRSDMGLGDSDRPKGIFLFVGQSGIGKTALATALARLLFNNDNALIRLDMSEYSERHSVAKLIGSPPGYVSHDEGGMLTEAVRKRPYSLILLDEIEKASQDVLNLFLQIADYGYLTDSSGRHINFKNTYIIMTSNAGSFGKSSIGTLGFVEERQNNTKELSERLKSHFKPEFINRFDEIIEFKPLNNSVICEIAQKELQKLQRKLESSYSIKLIYNKELIELITRKGYILSMGARSVIRYIVSEIERPITDILLEEICDGGEIEISAVDEKISFEYRCKAKNEQLRRNVFSGEF